MEIGNNNLFQVGCIIEAKSVGNNCVIAPKAYIGQGAIIGSNCVIGPSCIVKPGSVVDDNQILYCGSKRVKRNDSQQDASVLRHQKHIEHLFQVLPKYHSVSILE